jgi:hypothetical protein
LQRFSLRPRGKRELERLAVRDAVGVVAVVVEDVPHHRAPDPLAQPQHVGERERPVVVLDHQPRASRLGQLVEPAAEAIEPGLAPARGATDMEHDDRLRPEAHAVEQLRLHLELLDCERLHALVLRVQHRVLAGMAREPDPERPRPRADGREPLRAASRRVAELRQVGVRGVRREARRHPVHADVVVVAVLEDHLEVVEGDLERRPGLPAPRVV